MCANEPFGLYEYGTIEGIEAIQNQELYNHYKKILQESRIDIFITGKCDENYVKQYIIKHAKFTPRNINTIISKVSSQKGDINKVVDRFDVNQGKLCLGFKTGISPESEEYYSLMMFSGILGGGPHSKLFQNVREKASLAYYAYSRLEKFKGIVMIGSGIEIENYDKAYEIIIDQIEDIKDKLTSCIF
jgi:predicted Zn-dependent peptidase